MKKHILSELRLISYYIPPVAMLSSAVLAFMSLLTLNDDATIAYIPDRTIAALRIGATVALALASVLAFLALVQCCICFYRVRHIGTNAGIKNLLHCATAGILSGLFIRTFDHFMRGRIVFQADFSQSLNLVIQYDLEVIIVLLLGLAIILRQIALLLNFIHRRHSSANTITEP